MLLFVTFYNFLRYDDGITVADFGCGEARLARVLPETMTVHSFDLVALNDRVTECDMAQ